MAFETPLAYTSADAAIDRDGLAVIGRTLSDLRGHRFMSDPGGDPAPTAPPAAEPPAAPAGNEPPANQPPAASQVPTLRTLADGRTDYDSLPTDVQERMRALQKEAEGYRKRQPEYETLKQTAEQFNSLRAMVTGEGGQQPATPEELQQQLLAQTTEVQRAQQEADAAKRGLALVRVASLPDVQVNASRLLDSKSFEAKLAQIDPADDAALRALLVAEAEADQSLRIVPIAGGSGGGAHGGATPTTGRLSLKDAIAARNQQQGTPGR